MVRLNDDAQWIVLMGFLVSFSLFFLALVINQSTVVGQTTAESVIEFPKNDIRDVRSVILQSKDFSSIPINIRDDIRTDIRTIALSRKNAVVHYYNPYDPSDNTKIFYNDNDCVENDPTYNCTTIHYNNGVTLYHENWTSP